MKNDHTPTPWRTYDGAKYSNPEPGCIDIISGGLVIASLRGGRAPVDSEFIVRAVNSHDALVAALASIATIASCCPHDQPDECNRELEKIMDCARAAIAQAKGGQS